MQRSLGKEVNAAVDRNIKFVTERIASAKRAVTKEPRDAAAAAISDRDRSKTAWALDKVPGGEKARKLSNKRATGYSGVTTKDRQAGV